MIQNRIELVKLLPKDSVVAEVGVAEGLFSKQLLEAGVGRIYMVDNWEHIPSVTGDGNSPQDWHDKNYQQAVDYVSSFGTRAKLLRGMSVDMAKNIADESLDMVYLDAGHFFDAVAADLNAWYPKLKRNGIMAGHDYLCTDYQVKQAVDWFINDLDTKPEVFVIPETHINDAGFYFIKP